MKIIFHILSALLVLATGGFLYALSEVDAEGFMGSIRAMGNDVPAITSLLFSYIEYWWVILIGLALISLSPLCIVRHKTSTLFATGSLLAVFYAAYANVFYTLGAI